MLSQGLSVPCNNKWSTEDLLCSDAAFAGSPLNEAAVFVAHLRACTKTKDLQRGIILHSNILKSGLLAKSSDALIMMYANCNRNDTAEVLLDMVKSRDVITWTALITGFVREGQSQKALDTFACMQHLCVSPNAVTYTCILKACAAIRAMDKGKEIHDEIVRQGLLQNNIMLGTALVDMYAKCSALSKAQDVLENLPSRDVICWNALIAGYTQEGQGEQALNCFECMQREGIVPDSGTYTCILKACTSVGALDKGKRIHDRVARQGLLLNNIVLGNALVGMYAKCGALSKAEDVLETLSSSDVISWNALIAGYAQDSRGEQALNCFERMQCKGVHPNAATYASTLKACACIGAVDKGRLIHDEVVRQGLLYNDLVMGNALIGMYAKCGVLPKAQEVLENLPSRDVVSWSALIAGYAEEGQGKKVMNCLRIMQSEGILPNSVTYISILKACATTQALETGKDIHVEILEQGLVQVNFVLGNALVDMYAKCGATLKAQHVLENLYSRDAATWSILIAGYTEQGQGEAALNCFDRMQDEGILPNAVTYTCILKACGSIGAMNVGKQIHDEVVRQGLVANNIMVGNALVDMYAKCGDISKAHDLLEKLPSRDVVSWNTLVTGYAQEGQSRQTLPFLENMQHEGILPNKTTLVCLLSMFSHLGLVEEGCMYFVEMSVKYSVSPDLESYTRMADLFGRVGRLEKAVRLIEETPFSGDSALWLALLGACQNGGYVNIGRWAFEQAILVDKSEGPAYVLMANIYAAAGMLKKAKEVEALSIRNKASLQTSDCFE